MNAAGRPKGKHAAAAPASTPEAAKGRVEDPPAPPQKRESRMKPAASKNFAASESGKKDDAGKHSYMNMRAAVESQVEELKELFGHAVAYTVIAASMRTIDRFESQPQPLPATCGPRSLISVAFTFTGIPDEDVKRNFYLGHLVDNKKKSVQRMREEECLWAMALPFASRGAN